RPRKHANGSKTTGAPEKPKGCLWCLMSAGEGKKLLKCAKCGTATYCKVECQKAHWPVHKIRCFKPSEVRPLGLPGCIHGECRDDLDLYRQSIVPELLIAYRSAYSLNHPDFSYHNSLISIPLIYDSSRSAKSDRLRFRPNGDITKVSHADALALGLSNPRELENLALGAKITFGNKAPVVLPKNLIMVAVLYRVTDAEDRFDEISTLGLATVELEGCYIPFLPLADRKLNVNWADNLLKSITLKECAGFGQLALMDLVQSEGMDKGLDQYEKSSKTPHPHLGKLQPPANHLDHLDRLVSTNDKFKPIHRELPQGESGVPSLCKGDRDQHKDLQFEGIANLRVETSDKRIHPTGDEHLTGVLEYVEFLLCFFGR
ncbi:hypothetical protein P7C70_g2834, partial [Phenoliferia sp. Uapishka_3]